MKIKKINKITNETVEKLRGTESYSKVRIKVLKNALASTDYKAIKFAEGEMTAEEFQPIKEQRARWRAEINSLEMNEV
jgi:hypothetical protein